MMPFNLCGMKHVRSALRMTIDNVQCNNYVCLFFNVVVTMVCISPRCLECIETCLESVVSVLHFVGSIELATHKWSQLLMMYNMQKIC